MAATQANIQHDPDMPAWMCAHVPIPSMLPDITCGLMLVSGTFVSNAGNEEHVSCIRLTEVPLPVGTNGGPITVPYNADLNVLPELPAWFYSNGVAYVICQADIEDHSDYNLDHDKVNLAYSVTNLCTG